jgi:hypothetical protein
MWHAARERAPDLHTSYEPLSVRPRAEALTCFHATAEWMGMFNEALRVAFPLHDAGSRRQPIQVSRCWWSTASSYERTTAAIGPALIGRRGGDEGTA